MTNYSSAMSKSSSYRNVYDVPAYSVVDSSLVDSELWVTISCMKIVGEWITKQDITMYYRHPSVGYAKVYACTFDIHEKLLVLLALKYGHNQSFS